MTQNINKDFLEAIKNNDLEYLNSSWRWRNARTHFFNIYINSCLISSHDINSRFGNGSHCLSWAVRTANLQTVNYFILKGADVNLREEGGGTPLLLAIHLQRFEIVQCLNNSMAKIDDRDSYNTPLTLAVRKGHMGIIELLIDNKANYVDRDIKGFSALFLAIHKKNIDVLELFLRKRIQKDVFDINKNTPLIFAIRNDLTDIIQCLLNHGIDINKSGNEKTPLSWAVQRGNLEIVKLLHSKGANINTVSSDGNTALAVAVQHKHPEIAKYLIQNNANVCKVGEKGKTPLLWAVQNLDLDMIKLLLDSGADYIIDTIFLDAIKTKNIQIVQLFIERGARIHPKSKNDKIITLEASAANPPQNDATIVDDHPNEINVIINFLEKNNIEIVKFLIENGARLKHAASCGRTVLTKSVELENIEMVKYFVSKGAQVNQPDGRGLTPLVIAGSNNNFIIFQYLVDCGATINKEDEQKLGLAQAYQKAQQKRNIKKEYGSNQEANDA